MNRAEIGSRLQGALADSGRTQWELSRRADVQLDLVASLLTGSGAVPIEALMRIADALELEVAVLPGRKHGRAVGPIESKVDQAMKRLAQANLDQPPAAPASVADFLVEQRGLLDRLESFARSGAYSTLLSRVRDTSGSEPPAWIPEWLVRNAPDLDGPPLDLLNSDDDIGRMAEHLARMALCIDP